MPHLQHAMGSETEYGIVAVDQPEASPIHTSTQAVIAYAEHCGQGVNRRTRWDYEAESPLRDARGFDLRRYRAGSAPVLEPNALGAANVITASGARFYVDHAHPEYSSPEVTSAWDAVIWDQAGDRIMHEAAVAASKVPDQPQLQIYKNNVDGKGASYGTHENYLYPRDLDIEQLHTALIPHFVTRQIYCGAGRVGLGVTGEDPGFQISQRADYIETVISLETTLNRGIINTRDEPHAAVDQWRRLHVIIGDANLSQYATYLKFGTTALVLAAVQRGADFSDLVLYEPVHAVQQVSRDITLTTPIRLYGNTELTAIELQREIRRRVLQVFDGDDATVAAATLSEDDRRVLAVWGEVLDDLERDVLSTADRLDWVAKYALLSGYRKRGLGWDDPRMALIDLQYHDINPAKGLHHALVARGRMRTLVPEAAIKAAVSSPPRDTRAWLRGRMVELYSPQILAINWDSIIVDHPCGEQPATRIVLDQPLQFTAHEVEDLLRLDAEDQPPSLGTVVERIYRLFPDKVWGVG